MSRALADSMTAMASLYGFFFFGLFSHPIAGKTTLTESLKGALGATLLRSPPRCLSPFRERFDHEPPLIRRAFYALGNYITADQVSQEAAKAPVIVDR